MKLTIYYDQNSSIQLDITKDKFEDFKTFASGGSFPYYTIWEDKKEICIMRSAITSFVLDK